MLDVAPFLSLSKSTLSHPFVLSKIEQWSHRFPAYDIARLLEKAELFFLLSKKTFLEQHCDAHLFRLLLAIDTLQAKATKALTYLPESRPTEVKLLSTEVLFPFSSRPALGVLVCMSIKSRYEIFDDKSLLSAIHKLFPEVEYVKESLYEHPSKDRSIKILYLEIEKSDRSLLSLAEKKQLHAHLTHHLQASIEKVQPPIFMQRNEEELCKYSILLSQQIHIPLDIPQVYLSLERQTVEEIAFSAIVVFVAPSAAFDLRKLFEHHPLASCYSFERQNVVRHLEDKHLIEAHLCHIRFAPSPTLLRLDGSWNFYAAREKGARFIAEAIGDFRDFNGGLFLKQAEILHKLKADFPECDDELLETFFYSLLPLEKQASVNYPPLKTLFSLFLKGQSGSLNSYALRESASDTTHCISLHLKGNTLKRELLQLIASEPFSLFHPIYNWIEHNETATFNCILHLLEEANSAQALEKMRELLRAWEAASSTQTTLRISLTRSITSLDPRIGGDDASPPILKLLFEGLTRINRKGEIEFAIAEKIDISTDRKRYLFHLRPSTWNDSSPVLAQDFEYAWKKILSPDFKTPFSYLLHPIVNAKEAKQGKVSLEAVGVNALNNHLLEVELSHPFPYFLELTSHPLYSPVHSRIDQQFPQWSLQAGTSYPCNGPFQLKVHNPNEGFQLIRNPHYWDKKLSHFDKIVFLRSSPLEAYEAFQRGESDLLTAPLVSPYSPFSPSKRGKLLSLPSNHVCWCAFNTQKRPYNNLLLRKALSLAIDRSHFQSFLASDITPAYSPLPPRYSQLPADTASLYNPSLARQLFEEFRKEYGSPPLTLHLTHDNAPLTGKNAKFLKSSWQNILGIDCKTTCLSWVELFRQVTEGTSEISLMSWTSWIDDPIYTLNAFRHAEEPINLSKWENSQYAEYLDRADLETDPTRRLSYLEQAEKLLLEHLPIMPLFCKSQQILVHKDVDLEPHSIYWNFNVLRILTPKKRNVP